MSYDNSEEQGFDHHVYGEHLVSLRDIDSKYIAVESWGINCISTNIAMTLGTALSSSLNIEPQEIVT